MPQRQPPEQERERFTLGDARAKLALDRDRLDECLEQASELYDHVSEQHVLAVAERDATKLEIEEASAELDKQIRREAAENSEKITESAVTRSISLDRGIKQLERQLLGEKKTVDLWASLMKSYEQRFQAIRELSNREIARMYSRTSMSAVTSETSDAVTAQRTRQFKRTRRE